MNTHTLFSATADEVYSIKLAIIHTARKIRTTVSQGGGDRDIFSSRLTCATFCVFELIVGVLQLGELNLKMKC